MVASKNSLLGLDLEPSPPPSTSTIAASTDRNKRRKVVADSVVKNLNSYYKEKKISSKASAGI